jgi:hypothetical protein
MHGVTTRQDSEMTNAGHLADLSLQ